MVEESKKDAEKEFIEAINSNKLGTVRKFLKEGIEVDCLDRNGMSPLQHACYKGDVEICRLLIDHGANLNDNRHHHRYTALMFAALSGNKQVVSFMLSKGADANVVNSVKRTAAQMASFVGCHEIASIINNFINLEDLAKYSNIKDKDGKKLLTPSLLTSLHQYILTSNFNPVHLAYVLKEQRDVLQHSGEAGRVLEEMVEGLMKKRETDELAAIKLHYFSSYLQQAASFMGLTAVGKAGGGGACGSDTKSSGGGGDCGSDTKSSGGSGERVDGSGDARIDGDYFDTAFNKWIKFLMKRNTPLDSPPPNQELIIRRSLLSFPFHQSQLFQQIVSTVSLYGNKAGAKNGGQDNDGIGNLSAMSCLFNAINGQRMKNDEEDKQCATCEEFNGKACLVCRSVYYCNRECQKLNWSVHKVLCAQMKERKARMDRLKEQEEEKKNNVEEKENDGVIDAEEDGDEMEENDDDTNSVSKKHVDGGNYINKCTDDLDKTSDSGVENKENNTHENIEELMNVDKIKITDDKDVEIKIN